MTTSVGLIVTSSSNATPYWAAPSAGAYEAVANHATRLDLKQVMAEGNANRTHLDVMLHIDASV